MSPVPTVSLPLCSYRPDTYKATLYLPGNRVLVREPCLYPATLKMPYMAACNPSVIGIANAAFG
ncbi:MAG: hypothetical protein L7W43_06975 [Rubripirellula sp.]|nr:hypothetical protein [Rubripirellula sp.]